MSKKSRRKPRQPAPSAPASSEPPKSPRLSPVAKTILATLLATALVVAFSIVTSSGPTSKTYRIDTWNVGKQRVGSPGQDLQFPVATDPIVLVHHIPPHAAGAGTIEMEIFLERTVPIRVLAFHVGADRRPRGIDIGNQVSKAGWNPVRITADQTQALDRATEIGLQIVSLGPQVRMGIRNARLVRPSWFGRAALMARSLLKRQPLTQGSNNFNPSPDIAGRGYGFVLWVALPICLAVLLLRRFALRERLQLVPHIAITVLVLLILADLRNHADYLGNARAAIAKRTAAKDLSEYQANLENYFPWFGDIMRYLIENTDETVAFSPQIDKKPMGTWQAIHRLWYYALPRQRVWSLGDADIAFFYGESTENVDKSPDWKRGTRLPSGVLVYERVKQP